MMPGFYVNWIIIFFLYIFYVIAIFQTLVNQRLQVQVSAPAGIVGGGRIISTLNTLISKAKGKFPDQGTKPPNATWVLSVCTWID